MRCPALLLLAGCLLIGKGNCDALSGSFYGTDHCPFQQGWYPVPEAVCKTVVEGRGGKGEGRVGKGEEKHIGAYYANEINMPQVPTGCIKVCTADVCKLYFNRPGAEASIDTIEALGTTLKKCSGYTSEWNWHGRSCDWYADPTNAPSCTTDTNPNGKSAVDVCPECGQCQIECTTPNIASGAQSWTGAGCASGANVAVGTTCTITAQSGYFCTSPGYCGADGKFTATGSCDQRAKCSAFDSSSCPAGQYNSGSTECAQGADSCDAATCCEDKAKCSTFNSTVHPCPSGKYNPGASKDCPKGDDTCNTANCCEAKANCNAFSGACPWGEYNPGTPKLCPGGGDTCDDDGCCDVKLRCVGNSTTFNFSGRSCDWYSNPTGALSCNTDVDKDGLKALDVCPQCAECRVQCTVPDISGVQSWSGSKCAGGANVVAGTTCTINAQSDYFCPSSPGLCGHNGNWAAPATCFKKSKCSALNGTCPAGTYNAGAGKNCLTAAASCDVATCCEEKSKCSVHNATCPTVDQYNPGFSKDCPRGDNTCDDANCCDVKAKCSIFVGTCPHTTYNPGAGKDCPGGNNTCDINTCCDVRALCGTFTGTCPNGQQNPGVTLYNPDDRTSTECPGDHSTCDASLCCEVVPSKMDISPVCDSPGLGMMEAIENEAATKQVEKDITTPAWTVLLGAFMLSLGVMTYIIKARRMSRTGTFEPLLG